MSQAGSASLAGSRQRGVKLMLCQILFFILIKKRKQGGAHIQHFYQENK